MKSCLICQKKLRLIKFKCQSGHICKSCYEVVSVKFSKTIIHQTIEELLAIYQGEKSESEVFEMSHRINQFILFDKTHQKFCLPNHPKYTINELEPEYYSFSDIKSCYIDYYRVEKDGEGFGTVKVIMKFTGLQSDRQILMLRKAINCNSMPYKMMETIAQKIVEEVNSYQVV